MERVDQIHARSDSIEPESFDDKLHMKKAANNLSDSHELSSSSVEKATPQSLLRSPRKVVILASLCLITALSFETLTIIAPFFPREVSHLA